MDTRAQLVALLNSKVLTGGRRTTAQNIRDFENSIIASVINLIDDKDTPDGYLGIDTNGRVDVSFINASVPSGYFLRDDGTWASVLTSVSGLPAVLAVDNTSGGLPINMLDNDEIQWGNARTVVMKYNSVPARWQMVNTSSLDYIYVHDAGGIDVSTTALKLVGLTADTVPYVNGANVLVSSTVTSTVFNYITNLTSDAQTQLNAKLNLSGGTMTGPLILYTNTPATALEAASKGYVDSLLEGLDWKESVVTASTVDEPVLSGVQSVGGVVVSTGSRVLLKDQSIATDNGIWIVNGLGAWTRALDASTGTELEYAVVNVLQGTNADKVFRCTTYPITIGVTNITWTEWNVATYLAGSGLTLTGSTFSIGPSQVTNTMLAGSIDLTTKVTGVLPAANGGTGVANNAASTWTIAGAFATTITVTGVTGVTLPTSGTLTTTTGAETFTNKVSYNGLVITANTGAVTTGTWTASSISTTYTDAKIKGTVANTAGLVAYGTGTAETITTNANFVFDSTNVALIVGSTALVAAADVGLYNKSQNALTSLVVQNTNASGASSSGFAGSNGTSSAQMYQTGTGFTTSGQIRANMAIYSTSGVGGLAVYSGNGNANAKLYFYSNATLRASVDTAGLWTVTNAVASTHNFTMINTTTTNGAYTQYTVNNSSTVLNLGMVGPNTTTSGVYLIGEAYNMTTSTGWSFGTLNAAGVLRFYTANGTLCTYMNASGNVGIGTSTTVSARFHVISTTEQLRVGYDTSNYYSATVSSAGAVTFDATGASAGFTFSDKVIFSSTARLFGYTVATLPAGTVGDTAYVTDALAPAFLTAVVGGGAVKTPVFYDGTNWVAM